MKLKLCTSLAVLLALLLIPGRAPAQTNVSIGYDSLAHPYGAPILPENTLGLDVVIQDGRAYLDDRALVTEQMLMEAVNQDGTMTMSEDSGEPPYPGDSTNSDWTPPEFNPPVYGSNDLWLEITGVDTTNNYAFLTLHGTGTTNYYELWSRTNLTVPNYWTPVLVQRGDAGTSLFTANTLGNQQTFYWAQAGTVDIFLYAYPTEAYEPNAVTTNGVAGKFQIQPLQLGSSPDEVTVLFRLDGVASNGVDYVASVTNSITIPVNSSVDIDIAPLADFVAEGAESVTLTIIPTSSYLIEPGYNPVVYIHDNSTTISLYGYENATEPNTNSAVDAHTGYFYLTRSDVLGLYPPLDVSLQITGSAEDGVDYTNISSTVTFPDGAYDMYLYIEPLADYRLEGDETVTITVNPSTNYTVEPVLSTQTLFVNDNVGTNVFQTVSGLLGPIGIDYHALTDSLIVSYDHQDNGTPYNFARIYTNIVVSNSVMVTNVVFTNWSGIHGVPDEVKLAVLKSSANGFTNGDMFFGSSTGIGWLSADGTRSNLNWCILTNSTVTNALLLRGSLYVDQTGIFSNNVIAVTSPGSGAPGPKGVWRVDALGNPVLLTNLETPHLEGVITLPNDPNKWGPWAGKILTGDEDKTPGGFVYAIDTNGAVTSYDATALIPGGMRTEDFDIITTNQSLYVCAESASQILKLPASYLADYAGDLLITEAGENGNTPAKFFIIHWDSTNAAFVTRRIEAPFSSSVEHVTFAPIELPTP